MAGLRIAIAVVGIHYVVNLAHGVVHGGVPVPLTGGQTAFVVAVVGVGPLIALTTLRRGKTRHGWWLLAVVLVAGFLFGVAFHYLLATPDHVANVPAGEWKLPFDVTAALVAVVDGGGALVAGRFALEATRSDRAAQTGSGT